MAVAERTEGAESVEQGEKRATLIRGEELYRNI